MVEALRALQGVNLDDVEDDAELAKLLTDALQEWPAGHAQLREMRQQAVLRMRANKMSWMAIAQAMGLKHHSRAQQIARGDTGPQSAASKEKRSRSTSATEPDEE